MVFALSSGSETTITKTILLNKLHIVATSIKDPGPGNCALSNFSKFQKTNHKIGSWHIFNKVTFFLQQINGAATLVYTG